MEQKVNPLCVRVECINRIRKCYIKYKDIVIAELYHEFAGISGEFDWVIKPIWENWDLCVEKYDTIIDIAGIDDTLHKDEYIRNFNPSFVTQRTIPEGRDDLAPLLRKIGLNDNDLFEVLCRTHGICGNDDLYVTRFPETVVDVYAMPATYEIPDFDTDLYGWIIDGKIQGYDSTLSDFVKNILDNNV